MFGMSFNLTAAKAYVGALVASAGQPIAHWLVGLIDTATGLTLTGTQAETWLAGGLAIVLGYVAVYITPNKQTP